MAKQYPSISQKYSRLRKDKAVNQALLDGFKMGLAVSTDGLLDYGFGSRGLGTYAYNQTGKCMAFLPDY